MKRTATKRFKTATGLVVVNPTRMERMLRSRHTADRTDLEIKAAAKARKIERRQRRRDSLGTIGELAIIR